VSLARDGYVVFPPDRDVARWAAAARDIAPPILRDPAQRGRWLRHGGTWFAGVDALPNAADGSIGGVDLRGPWQAAVACPAQWHKAQLSAVWPGYPGRDPKESDAAHRYRRDRFAAHLDGLLPIGPDRRRHLREPHRFILGLPLTQTPASPLVIWPGSHRIMGQALARAIGEQPPGAVDLTEAYQAARRAVFAQIAHRPLVCAPGQAVLLHRHMLHGIAPWEAGAVAPEEGRVVAYFRPQYDDLRDWL